MLEEMDAKRYADLVAAFANRSVLVLGDLMVDEYLSGVARRISPEGPTMVVEVVSNEVKPGGAANVGNNLRALGARVAVAGVVGRDEGGRLLESELNELGIDTSLLLEDTARPTTRKTRIVAQNQQVLRVDRESAEDLDAAIEDALLEGIRSRLEGDIEIVLVSDYRKGVFTPGLAVRLQSLCAERHLPIVANTKPASAGWLPGARAVTLNQAEAEEAARRAMPRDDAAVAEFGMELRAQTGAETLVVTRGSRGLSFWNDSGMDHIPAHRVEVFDVAGAGDTTVSVLTLAIGSGATDREAAIMANYAGACVVRKAGVATLTPEELLREPEPHSG